MYHAHFGLRDLPFSFNPSTSGLFMSAGHREGLAALEWGLREPSGFTMLVGEVGTGKTTLIWSLLAREHPTVRTAQIVNPTMSFEEMLRSVMEQLGMPTGESDKSRLLQGFAAAIAKLPPTEKVAIIIDEAQDLSYETLEELRLLSNFDVASASGLLQAAPSHKSLQIVLVGQPELVRRLKDPKLQQLDQRIGARAMLPPLRLSEVYDYMDYRVRAQGGDLHKLFRPGALSIIARQSGGIPRRINVLCHSAFLQAFAEGQVRVSAKHAEAAGREYEDLLASSSQRAGQEFANSPTFWAAPLAYSVRALRYWLRRMGPVVPIAILIGVAIGAGGGWYAFRRATEPRSATAAPVEQHLPATEAGSREPAKSEANPAEVAAPEPPAPASSEDSAERKVSTFLPDPPAAQQAGAAPIPIEAAAPAVVVKEGDTLSKIALGHFGSDGPDQIRRLLKANPQILDANRIYPGQTIALGSESPGGEREGVQ